MPLSLLEREEIPLAVTEDRDTPWATIAHARSSFPDDCDARSGAQRWT